MDVIYDLLIEWGYWGMSVAAFIAGSIFPFSSETVVIALQLAGLHAWELFIFATVGNVCGSMLTYSIGRIGNPDWIVRYLHVKPQKMARAQDYVNKHGPWIGFFCFVPFLGNAMVVTMGFMRTDPLITILSIAAGKATRYAVIIYAVSQIDVAALEQMMK